MRNSSSWSNRDLLPSSFWNNVNNISNRLKYVCWGVDNSIWVLSVITNKKKKKKKRCPIEIGHWGDFSEVKGSVNTKLQRNRSGHISARWTFLLNIESRYGGGFHIQNREEINTNTNNTHWEETQRQKKKILSKKERVRYVLYTSAVFAFLCNTSPCKHSKNKKYIIYLYYNILLSVIKTFK